MFVLVALLLFLVIIEPRWYSNIYVVIALLLSFALNFIDVFIFNENFSDDLTYTLSIIMIFALVPATMLTFSVLTFSNSKYLMEKEGKKKSNLFVALIGLATLAMLILFTLSYSFTTMNHLVELLLLYVTGIFSYFAAFYTATVLYAGLYVYRPILYTPDYIIVLGSGIIGDRVPPLLASRLKKAVQQYAKYGCRPLIIVSGGQGHDEKVSEAFAMKKYIHDHFNVPDEDVLMEDKSTTTLENMAFSKKLIDARFNQPKGIFVTNNFHVLRGGFYAKKVGLVAQGVGSTTAFYYLPNAFTREFIGMLEMYKWRHVFALVVFSVVWYVIFNAYT
ncbi:MAG: YdcF family protein [Solibacillus sp.]